MGKRKASTAQSGSSKKRSAAAVSLGEEMTRKIDLSVSTPNTIKTVLLSWLPDGATKHHTATKNLYEAMDLLGPELDCNANKLVTEASTSGARKPFSFLNGEIDLPEDLFLGVLDYLSAPVVVHKVSLVSKTWLSATRTTWKCSTFDATGMKKRPRSKGISMKQLMEVLWQTQLNQLKTLVLPYKVQLGSTGLQKIAERCPNLQALDISYTSGDLIASVCALADLPHLLPNLTKVHFTLPYKGLTSKLITGMGSRLLEMRSQCTTFTQLSDEILVQIGDACPNLARFDYLCSRGRDDVTETGVVALVRGCTKLKHLLLVRSTGIDLEAFEFIANFTSTNKESSLRYLQVDGIPSLFGSPAADLERSRLVDSVDKAIFNERCESNWNNYKK